MMIRAATKRILPAVGYLRMSTDRQEDSPGRQRERITAYAAENGYEILDWYFDAGISGAATERRKDFLRMVARGVEVGDFEAMLVENMDRLSRDDSVKFGQHVGPLADVGIVLVSVAERRVYNLADATDRTLLTLGADFTRNRYLVDMSDKTTSALIRNAKLGKWTGGAVPYGLARMLVTSDGQPIRQRERGECRPTGEKFRGCYVVLVPGDPDAVAIVQGLFKQYAQGSVSLWSLGAKLNADGIPAPNGGLWRKESVRNVLTHRAYAGDHVFGLKNRGKFHSVALEGIRTAAEVQAKRKEQARAVQSLAFAMNPFGDPIIAADAFESIVDRKTFETVQRKLSERKKLTTPQKAGAGFMLTGLVFCGHCGGAMHGKNSATHKGKYHS